MEKLEIINCIFSGGPVRAQLPEERLPRQPLHWLPLHRDRQGTRHQRAAHAVAAVAQGEENGKKNNLIKSN